jgi:hypothetical protein
MLPPVATTILKRATLFVIYFAIDPIRELLGV